MDQYKLTILKPRTEKKEEEERKVHTSGIWEFKRIQTNVWKGIEQCS